MRSLSLASLILPFLSLLLTGTSAQIKQPDSRYTGRNPGMDFSLNSQSNFSRQGGCLTQVGPLFEIPGKVLHGYSLAARTENDGYYLGGLLNDSALLVRYDLQGKIIWARTLDVIPGVADHISAVMVDSDGMLVASGTSGEIDNTNGGPIFVFRYDPNTHQVLWTKEFVTNVTRNFNWTIIEKNPGGNYLISNIPVDENASNVNAELFELNRNTGNVMPGIFKNLDLGSSEEITSMLVHKGFLYGTGRFSLGGSPSSFRQSLIKMDPSDGSIVWSKVGHRPGSADARLYGVDLLIADDNIYHCYFGDPDGTSVSNTNFYVQKTNLNGDMSWVKQYQLPGNNDWGYEMITSGNGIVILAAQRAQPYAYFLYKIDFDGNVIWAQRFPLANPFYTAHPLIGDNQLIEVGGQYVFTGYDVTSPEEARLIVYRTDLNGVPLGLCTEYDPTTITAATIENPVFFDVTMIETEPDFSVQNITMAPSEVTLPYDPNCFIADTIFFGITDTICTGESLEGYTATGTYEDYYTSAAGCDSVRIIHLTVIECGPDCGGDEGGNLFGTASVEEGARCLATTIENDAVYVAGYKEDSTLLVKVDLSGNILWSRVIDVIPGESEVPTGIVADADGMIAVAGTGIDQDSGGVVYAFRYDPTLHAVLWAHTYSHSPNDYSFGMIEKGPGGNYLLTNNPTYWSQTLQAAEVVEIDKTTGLIVPAFSKNYLDHDTETLLDLAYHDNFVYGVGRYKNGGSQSTFRSTLVKLDQNTGDQVWVKMGHRSASSAARLYGTDLVIADNSIFAITYGDPAGASTSATKVFIHRHDLDGNLVWIRQYEIPGANEISFDLVRSGNGLIAYVYEVVSGGLSLFKIDLNGNVLWANTYTILAHSTIGSVSNVYGNVSNANTVLTQAGNRLIFTNSNAVNNNGDNDVLIIQTDLDGNIQTPCVQSEPFTLTAQVVNNPVFYDDPADQSDVTHETNNWSPISNASMLAVSEACNVSDTIYSFIELTICSGDTAEGYSVSGSYVDAFVTSIGCDSIRTLVLHVNACNSLVSYNLDACSSFMSNGSHMDYSEFDPEYPNEAPCASLAATNVFRDPPQENKHSCTPGVNGSIAMCISSLPSCTYIAGHEASLVFEVNIVPDADSAIRISKLEFFERSPLNYVWIGGNTGANNYPRFYGVRVLANNVEIFRQTGIGTHADWTLQSFEFPDITGFTITTPTLLRVEWLPYCPIGNGAPVAAWDVDEINLFGGCVTKGTVITGISGDVKTQQGLPVPQVKIRLGENHYGTSDFTFTDQDGQYHFDNLKKGLKYYVKGNSNRDLLQGVSTLDLIGIQKHLLGIKAFEFLPQYIAADINHNGKINVSDIVDLRKTLLGIHQDFPNNTSWRIGNCDRMNSNDTDDFREAEELGPVTEDHMQLDFMGIKVGDVNGDINLSANPTLTSRSFEVVELELEKTMLEKADEWYVEVKATKSFMTEGMQLSLDFANMRLKEVIANAIPLTSGYYSFSKEQKLHISWNTDKPVKIGKDEILFAFVVKLDNQISHFEIAMEENGLRPESYLNNEISEVIIRGIQEAGTPIISDIAVMPNPYTSGTTIQFIMAEPGEVTFTFYDLAGKELNQISGEYGRGIQKFQVNSTIVTDGAAVIICQLQCNGQFFTEKLVRIQ